MRFCPSARIVEEMRNGKSPEIACTSVINSIFRRLQRSGLPMFEMAVLAMNSKGEVGAGSTFGNWIDHVTGETWPGFPYAVSTVNDGVRCCEMRVCPGMNREGEAGGEDESRGGEVFPTATM